MATTSPLVSVIIPAHNGEAYLAEAVESILAQTYVQHEILVLDNASTDNTAAIACSYPQIKYRYHAEANTATARNQGITQAQGKYIAFLDQDDTWHPQKLEKQVGFLEATSATHGVISQQKIYLQEGCPKPHWLKNEFLDQPQTAYLPSALMIRRHLFETTALFDSHFALASDVAWFFKVKDLNIRIDQMDEVLLYRRIHNDNASNKLTALHQEYLNIIQQSIRQKRSKNI